MSNDCGPEKVVEKVWGNEQWWVNTSDYCFKILTLHPGFMSSLHYHKKKRETFILWSGGCELTIQRRDKIHTYELKPGDKVVINPGQLHRFWLKRDAKEDAIIYEVSTHHDDDDVVRAQESKQI